nr:hypothetical protein [Tanacetum cinerariifolium]
MPKEKKHNFKCTARISVHPCFFPTLDHCPLFIMIFHHPTDYQSTPPSTLNASPSLSPYNISRNLTKQILLTLKSTPPPLTSLPPAPIQPSKHSLPLAINLDPTKLLFFTPPTSPQTLFDTLEDVPPTTTNLPPPRLSFESIKHLANEPPPILAIKPPLPPLPP